jgi:hypothetical protein
MAVRTIAPEHAVCSLGDEIDLRFGKITEHYLITDRNDSTTVPRQLSHTGAWGQMLIGKKRWQWLELPESEGNVVDATIIEIYRS